MRRHIFLLTAVAFLFLSTSVLLGGIRDSRNHPKAQIADDYWYFGHVPEGTKVVHDYWIRNVGGDTLHIVKVTPGCGCTGTRMTSDIIPAGDSARLRVIFDSKNIHGKVVKDVNVMTDDPENPYMTVRFFAVLTTDKPEVTVEPAVAVFPEADAKSLKLKTTLQLHNVSDTSVELSIVDLPSPEFSAMFSRDKIPPGGNSKLEILMQEPPEQPGIIGTSMTIEYSGKEKDRITIPISGFYRP
jgi:hypothetical protein